MKSNSLAISAAIFALILAMLACSKADDVQSVPTKLPTETAQIANIATSTPAPTATKEQTCVEVSSGGYLHLRGDADENSRVIDWMQDGSILTLLASYGNGWSLVEYNGVLGYVKTIYIKEAICQ